MMIDFITGLLFAFVVGLPIAAAVLVGVIDEV